MLMVLILLGAVLPLLIAPGLAFHYDTTPRTILLCVAAVAALSRFREIPSEVSALWSRAGGRILTALLLLTTLWYAVAAAFSSRPILSLVGSGWRELGLATIAALCITVFLAAAHLCRYPGRIAVLLRASTVAGLAVSIYGIAQYFDIDPFQSAQGYRALDGDSVVVRPPGTFGHADYFGWWLAIEFFCALALAKTEGRRWKMLGAATACLSACAAVLTGTRSAVLAITAGAFALLLIYRPQVRMKHAFTSVAAAGLFVLFLFSPPGTRLRNRIAWSEHEPAGGARPLLWRDSVRMAMAKPVTGFGPETFSAAFGPWESDELGRLFPDFHHESPHNVALDALTSAGLPGLLLVLAWATVALRVAVRAVRSGYGIAAPLAAGLLASGVAGIFCAAVMPPLLLTLLLVGALTATEKPDRIMQISRRRLPIAALAFPAAAGIAVFACLLAVSDYRLARFQQHPGASEYQAILRLPVAVAAEDAYCARVLASTCSTPSAGGSPYECWRTALRAASRATSTADDTANAWYNLAQFTAAQNDIRGTRAALSGAIAAAPKWFKPHWAMAELLSRTGDAAGARTEAGRAESLHASHNPELSAALAQLKMRVE